MTKPQSPGDDPTTDGAPTDGPETLGVLGETSLSHAERVELIDAAYAFPGMFPIVVIAASDAEFHMTLQATVAAEQGEAAFRIQRRLSREGRYASYRVEVHVESAEAAIARQTVLAALPGIRALL